MVVQFVVLAAAWVGGATVVTSAVGSLTLVKSLSRASSKERFSIDETIPEEDLPVQFEEVNTSSDTDADTHSIQSNGSLVYP